MSKTAKKAAKKKAAKKATPKRTSSVKKKAGAAKKTNKVAGRKAATKPSTSADKKVLAKPSSSAGKKAVSKKSVSKKPVGKKPIAKKPAPPKASSPHPPLLAAIIEGLEERKAHNITVLDLNSIGSRSFDYFVIADADSKTHVESIAGSVEEEVKKKLSERPYHTEGWQNAEWILLDYVNIVVHVFQRPIREFYNLEGLWADAEVQKIN